MTRGLWSTLAAAVAVLTVAWAAGVPVGCTGAAEGGSQQTGAAPAVGGEMAMARDSGAVGEPLICLWQHEQDVDIAPLVKELGFNVVWTDDPSYNGQRWEDTHMYRALQVPGVKYVIPKIERAAWGWTHEGSLKSARWIAQLSLEHKGIIGLYLNDFYDELEEGHRTMEQWREIIAAARSVNPNLNLWVPHYPHRRNEERAYDMDYQGVVLNIWDPRNLDAAAEHLATAQAQHAGKIIVGGLYINSGARRGHWLTEDEFKKTLRLHVEHVNAGKLAGIRIFCACQLAQRPEYVRWTKEVLAGLKRPQVR